jgi:hypothetical protein
MQPAPLSALDGWKAKQKDQPTRAEAIRRLVELGLTVKTKAKQPSAARAVRAKELAKGPSEFREDRVDLPKAKGK